MTVLTLLVMGAVEHYVSAALQQQGLSREQIQASVMHTLWPLLLLLVLLTGCGEIGVGLLAHRLTRPMAALTVAVEQVGPGNLEPDLPISGPDEVGRLAAAFGDMLTRLRQSQRESAGNVAQLERQVRDLWILHTISAAAARSLDLSAVLVASLAEILEALDLQAGWILLCTDDSRRLRLVAQQGLSPAFIEAEETLLEREHCICTDVLCTGETRLRSNMGDCPYLPRDLLVREGLKAHASIPLKARDHIFGLMNLASIWETAFDQRDLHLLTTIGQQIGIAIDHAQLFTTVQRELAQSRALFEVSKALISSHTLQDILTLIVTKAAEVMHTDNGTLQLVEEESGELHVQAVHGLSFPQLVTQRCYGCEAVARQAIQERQPQMIPDFRGYLAAHEMTAGICAETVSLLCLPLEVKGQVIGALTVGTHQTRYFTAQDVQFLTTFSGLAALAIENARLVTSSILLPEIHHRVKNNLQDIASLLSLQLRRVQSDEGREALMDTINRIKSIALVHDLLSDTGRDQTDLRDVARRIVDRVIAPLTPPDQDLRVEIRGDSVWLPSRANHAAALVLNELCTNALKHAFRDRPTGRLVIELQSSDHEVTVLIQDDGVGIGEDVCRGERRGLGLKIVETLVQRDLRGRLQLVNEAGTTVRLTFPRPRRGRL
jgi:two-component sensor histidine kinase/HAMP domain-containing protein